MRAQARESVKARELPGTTVSYSPFFQILYDEPKPTDRAGGGAHYSVLRAPIWHDDLLNPLPHGDLLDFAVIWDQDHDLRVMAAIEEMYFGGLLSPVRFIGERDGRLSVLIAARTVELWSESMLLDYRAAVSRLSHGIAEPWSSTVDHIFGRDHSIMEGAAEEVDTYLDDIQLRWQLGRKSSLVHLKPARRRWFERSR